MDTQGPTDIMSSFHELYLSAQAYLFRFISPRSFRLLLILSIYLIARPYLLKGGAKRQAQDHDKVLAEGKAKGDARPTSETVVLSPTSSDSKIVTLEDVDSDEEMSRKDGGKAKRRQLRRTMQEIVEDKPGAADGAESDGEIENLLRKSIR